jgi:SRSO17 transposase
VNPTKRLPKARATRRPPASGRPATGHLNDRDIATSGDELIAFHRPFQALFQRREQRDWSRLYLCGQLVNLERKTVEGMVLELVGPEPNAIRGLQQFIGQSDWDTQPLVEAMQSWVAQWWGEPEGVVIVDGSGFPKQGHQSVGVGRQYCGHLGKVANCQQGVFSAYASRRGYAFVDERLYVLADWFEPEARPRWQACGIPDQLRFQTEPQLALEMITGLAQRGVLPFRWVACDEGYGKSPAFLDGIADLGKWYLAEVARDRHVWRHTPQVDGPGRTPAGQLRTQPRLARSAPAAQELRALEAQLPPNAWQQRVIKEGSKGPLMAEFACLRVTPVQDQLPGQRCWAVFRRNLGPQREVKYYLSNAPADCTLADFVRVSGLRWPIETALEEGKSEVGLDQYETRTWSGWHHHMCQAMLAHLFLMRLRLLFQKKSSPDHRPGAPIGGTCHPRQASAFGRHAVCGDLPLSSTPQSRRLSRAPQASAFKHS